MRDGRTPARRRMTFQIPFLGLGDTTKMNSKGRMIWYNILPSNVHLTDIYPRKQVGNPANDIATVLDFPVHSSPAGCV